MCEKTVNISIEKVGNISWQRGSTGVPIFIMKQERKTRLTDDLIDLRINEGLNGRGVTVVAPVTVERNDEACHRPILLLPGTGVIQHHGQCMGLQMCEYCAMHMATL